MKRSKLLSLYEKWSNDGVMPASSLTSSMTLEEINWIHFFNLMSPNGDEKLDMARNEMSLLYWDSGCKLYDENKRKSFTTLRKNILLLYAAATDQL